MTGRGTFMKAVRESSEMLGTAALAEPPPFQRRRPGPREHAHGEQQPCLEAKEYLGGYYLVECTSRTALWSWPQ